MSSGISRRHFVSFVACAASTIPLRAETLSLSIPRLPALTQVKVASVRGSLTNAGLTVAMEKGYFRESNLDIAFTPFPGIMDMVAPTATGQLDVATGVPSAAFFNAVARGIHLKIVADSFTARPGMGSVALLVRKDLYDDGKVRDFSDLKGRTITVTARGGVHEMMVFEALRRGGLSISDVRMASIPTFPEVNVALANKAIDAGVQIEPLVAIAAEKDIAVRWKGMDELLPNIVNTFFMFSESFAARRDIADAWMVAYLRGVRDYYDAVLLNGANRDEILSMMAKYLTVKDLAAYRNVVFPGINPDGEVDAASVETTLKHFQKTGDVSAHVTMDGLIDTSFTTFAIDSLGRYRS